MIRPFGGKTPQLGEGVFVAPSADLIGDVVIGARSSIWYCAVLRGDVESIRVGAETSIQDNTVVHVDSSGYSTVIGDRVTVGHSVVLHGCSIGDDALVGIGSVVLNGAEVGVGARAIQVSKGGYRDFFQNLASVAGQEVALEVRLDPGTGRDAHRQRCGVRCLRDSPASRRGGGLRGERP